VTLLQFALVMFAQTAQVAGQLLLKKGMTRTHGRGWRVVAGTAMLTFWFLAWLKLLQSLDISYLYPFEGISLVMLVLAAQLFLQERLDAQSWIGVTLITSGMILVGMH
jgi:multidrug transporter EmrE-like cation transporter